MFHYREQHADNKYLSLPKTYFFSLSKSFFFGEQPVRFWKVSHRDVELRHLSKRLRDEGFDCSTGLKQRQYVNA